MIRNKQLDVEINMEATFNIIHGDSLESLKTLESNSVHLIVSSPPYYPQVRDYNIPPTFWADGDKCALGFEGTPDQFVNHLVRIFGECHRVLRDDGTLWVNMGDSYAKHNKWKDLGIKKKDLLGIPWLFAFAMRKSGWWLRNDIIWSKLDPLPNSVADRCVRSHEYIFQFAKSEKYYYDRVPLQEPAKETSIARVKQKNFSNQKGGDKDYGKTGLNPSRSTRKTLENFAKNPIRNKRTVWSFATANYKGSHMAVFPETLPSMCIKSGTSEYGVCSSCHTPWARDIQKTRIATRPALNNKVDKTGKSHRDPERHVTEIKTLGWKPSCDCGTNSVVPAVVLDPFSGAGTSGVAAVKLGRKYIGVELNEEQVKVSKKRIRDIDPIFTVEK